MSSEITNDIFKLRDNTYYHLRHTRQFLGDPIHGVFNSSESVSCLAPKTWEKTHSEIKNISSLDSFKKEVKKVEPHELSL